MTKKNQTVQIDMQLKVSLSLPPNPQMPFSGTTASFWYILIEKSTNIQGYMNIYTFLLYS